MYKLEYLPYARKDMMEIIQYISKEMNNPAAAERLAETLIEAGDRIPVFPYAHAVHMPIRQLKHEYRQLQVGNYLMLYRVDETEKLVTIVRVLYAKKDER